MSESLYSTLACAEADLNRDIDEGIIKELLRPAKKHLVRVLITLCDCMLTMSQKKLKSGTDGLSREEKIAVLKECLSGIGSRISEVVSMKAAEGESATRWRKHCWM